MNADKALGFLGGDCPFTGDHRRKKTVCKNAKKLRSFQWGPHVADMDRELGPRSQPETWSIPNMDVGRARPECSLAAAEESGSDRENGIN